MRNRLEQGPQERPDKEEVDRSDADKPNQDE